MKASQVFIFAAGVASGFLGGYFYLSKKFEKELAKQIEEITELYSSKTEEKAEEEKKTEEPKADSKPVKPTKIPHAAFVEAKKNEMEEQAEILSKARYNGDEIDYGHVQDIEEVPVVKKHTGPQLMSVDEFNDEVDYEKEDLILYGDYILADAVTDEIIESIEETVGWDNLNIMIKDPRRDSIHLYIRNDELRTCYEVVYMTVTYKEYTGWDPKEV